MRMWPKQLSGVRRYPHLEHADSLVCMFMLNLITERMYLSFFKDKYN